MFISQGADCMRKRMSRDWVKVLLITVSITVLSLVFLSALRCLNKIPITQNGMAILIKMLEPVSTIAVTEYVDKNMRLRIRASDPQQYKIRILKAPYQAVDLDLDKEGKIDISIPGNCYTSLSIFGFTYLEETPYKRPMVGIVKDKKIVRQFYIKEMETLPIDEQGYRTAYLSE